jgi:hypothetical protein
MGYLTSTWLKKKKPNAEQCLSSQTQNRFNQNELKSIDAMNITNTKIEITLQKIEHVIVRK